MIQTQQIAGAASTPAGTRRSYPLIVGVLLGALQTGLFFQLTFTLSSGFTTYLLITLCWLLGGALGSSLAPRLSVSLRGLQAAMLIAYALCGVLVLLFPFNTALSPAYCLLIGAAGLYPGVFFARESTRGTARGLFFWENNGFIIGLALTTVVFMLAGRAALWLLPAGLALLVWVWSAPADGRG
ncbi:MAG: hypothetical protein JNL42_05785 [Anaerolineae bacterium]|nr:hypothetical protein [Anaerolineae bacterium]